MLVRQANFCAVIALLTVSCAPRPISVADIHRYTHLKLCPSARLQDQTTQQERDGVAGFSFHVGILADSNCAGDLERQLVELSSGYCTPETLTGSGCWFELSRNLPRSAGGTSVIIEQSAEGTYDLRFFK